MSKKKNTCNGSIMSFFMKKGADYEMSALTAGDYEVDSPTQKLDFTQEEEEGDHTQTDMLSQPLLTTPPVKDEMHSPVKSEKKRLLGTDVQKQYTNEPKWLSTRKKVRPDPGKQQKKPKHDTTIKPSLLEGLPPRTGDVKVWVPTKSLLEGEKTAAAKDMAARKEREDLEEEARRQAEKDRRRKVRIANAKARQNATSRLRNKFALSLESPSENRQKNRDVADQLGSYITIIMTSAEELKLKNPEYNFRGQWFVGVLLERLKTEIEQPCFRVDTLTTETIRKTFQSCIDNPGLADFLRNFMDNIECMYEIEPEFDNVKMEFHYITRWYGYLQNDPA